MPIISAVVTIGLTLLIMALIFSISGVSDFAQTFSMDTSMATSTSVSELIRVRQGATIELLIGTLLVTMLFAPIVALIGNIRIGTWRFKLLGSLYAGLPVFWFALLLLYGFGISMDIEFMRGGLCEISGGTPCDEIPLTERYQYLIAPIMALSMGQLGRVWLRLRHEGGTPIWHSIVHSGINVGWLLSGLIVVEVIFSLPGLGRLLYTGAIQLDFPVMRGALTQLVILGVITQTIFQIVLNFLDLRYAPRAKSKNHPESINDVEKNKDTEPVRMLTVLLRPSVIIGVVVIALVMIVFPMIVAVMDIDPNRVNISARNASPSAEYLLGTDSLGRDLLTRILVGTTRTMGIALTAGIIATVLSVVNGWILSKIPFVKSIIQNFAFGVPIAGIMLLMVLVFDTNTSLIGILIGLMLAPFIIAWWLRNPPSRQMTIPVVFGLLLLAVADAIMIETLLGFLGLSGQPPVVSLGGIFEESLLRLNDTIYTMGIILLVIVRSIYVAAHGLLPQPDYARNHEVVEATS